MVARPQGCLNEGPNVSGVKPCTGDSPQLNESKAGIRRCLGLSKPSKHIKTDSALSNLLVCSVQFASSPL